MSGISSESRIAQLRKRCAPPDPCTATTRSTSGIVDERVAQFRDQTRRFLAGELAEDEFRPLRLQNGLYIQRHAPMLRVAIPYGLLSSRQLRKLAHIARKYDRGYGHFTHAPEHPVQLAASSRTCPTSWPSSPRCEMHAIQTSGNCIRNITTDHFAGVAPDEIVDPRPSGARSCASGPRSIPEFAFLPRKFKIAVNGADGRPRRDPACTTSACTRCATTRARSASA